MACIGCPPVVGVKSCPVANMTIWKGLGINTLFLSETQSGLYSRLQWRSEAASRGLKYIDYPSADLASDELDNNLIAYVLPLYPDRNGISVPTVQSIRDSIRAASPTKPILLMLGGANITFGMNSTPPYNGSLQKSYMPGIDWVGQDWEPFNSDPSLYNQSIIGSAMNLLGQWSGGLPQLALVECAFGNFAPTGRSPTTDEMKNIVRTIMQRVDCIGYIFDPTQQAGGGYSYTADATTSDMKIAITQINAEFSPVSSTRAPQIILWNDGTWSNA